MATLSTNAPRTALVSGSGLSGLIARTRDALHRRGVYRQTRQELEALSTRELADLGISRSMITRMAWEAAYGK